MNKIIESYFSNLALNPERLDSMFLWTVTSIIITVVLIKYSKQMVNGLMGKNTLWESPEIVIYLLCWLFPYILNYAAFFKATLPDWVWWFMSAGIAYALMGRWIFDWVLALRAGATSVTESATVTKTETKVEVKQEKEL
jgi:hypothetical protein